MDGKEAEIYILRLKYIRMFIPADRDECGTGISFAAG